MDIPFAAMYAGVSLTVLTAALRDGELATGGQRARRSRAQPRSRGLGRRARVEARHRSPAERHCGAVCSTSLSLAAAAHTIWACSRPGWRLSRSIGPETETAATIRPAGPRTGADTEATPGSRSPTDCDHPRRRTADKAVAVKRASRKPAVQPLGLLPGQQDLGRRAGLHRQRRTDGHRVAQAGQPLGRGNADPAVALPAIELRALAGDVAQPGQHRSGRLEQAVLAGGGGELAQPGAEHEAALQVARDEPVVLERGGEPVGRRAGQSGG